MHRNKFRWAANFGTIYVRLTELALRASSDSICSKAKFAISKPDIPSKKE